MWFPTGDGLEDPSGIVYEVNVKQFEQADWWILSDYDYGYLGLTLWTYLFLQ